MSIQIESSEFGDWLSGEISKTVRQTRPGSSGQAPASVTRLEALQIAAGVLYEFMTIQEGMLTAARAALDREPRRRSFLSHFQEGESTARHTG